MKLKHPRGQKFKNPNTQIKNK